MDPVIGAQIGGTMLDFVSNQSNMARQQEQNMFNAKFSDYMYDKQKKDSIEFWNMQNAYNTPAAQMERYRQAGLNPNLIYGKAGDNSASNIDRPTQQMPNMVAPKNEFSATQKLNEYYNNQNIKKTNSLLQENIDKTREEKALIQAQKLKVQSETNRNTFDLGYLQKNELTNTQILQEQSRKIKNEADYIVNKYGLESAMNSANILRIGSEILRNNKLNGLTEQQTQSVMRDIKLKDLDIGLKEIGLQPSDPAWQRILFRTFANKKYENMSPEEISRDINRMINSFGKKAGRTLFDLWWPFGTNDNEKDERVYDRKRGFGHGR